MDYNTHKTIHDDIIALYASVAAAKCYFRNSSPDTTPTSRAPRARIDRDRTICALVNKLVTTQQAILTLCESQLGDDAYALSRIAMENAVIIAWLLHDDHWCRRIDVYVNSHSQAVVRLDRVVQDHYPDTQGAQGSREPVSEDDVAIYEELFDGNWRKWARYDGRHWTFKDMAAEVFDGNFFYDHIFLKTSWYVHSALHSCLSIADELQNDDVYNLQIRKNRETATEALFLSNAAALISLSALNRRIRIDLSTDIDTIFARFRQASDN